MSDYTNIISAADLRAHLQDPAWVVVDCRFDLKNPEWGSEAYRQAHIPGAVYAHLDRDLSGPISERTGRHPLPEIDTIITRLRSWGISNQSQVICYDTSGGAYAARLWWLLRFLGHRAVAVLDGCPPAWQQAGYPLSGGVETRPPADFSGSPQWEMLVTAGQVDQLRRDPNYRLIDARSPERFRGEVEPIDKDAGHIPGAVNRFHGENLSADGTFLPPTELHAGFERLLDGVDPRNAIVYCGSGVTSVHHLIAMDRAGLPLGRLYLGSWSEWIRDPQRPVGKATK